MPTDWLFHHLTPAPGLVLIAVAVLIPVVLWRVWLTELLPGVVLIALPFLLIICGASRLARHGKAN